MVKRAGCAAGKFFLQVSFKRRAAQQENFLQVVFKRRAAQQENFLQVSFKRRAAQQENFYTSFEVLIPLKFVTVRLKMVYLSP